MTAEAGVVRDARGLDSLLDWIDGQEAAHGRRPRPGHRPPDRRRALWRGARAAAPISARTSPPGSPTAVHTPMVGPRRASPDARRLNDLPELIIEPIVRAALAEDLGRAGDITSSACIPADARLSRSVRHP